MHIRIAGVCGKVQHMEFSKRSDINLQERETIQCVAAEAASTIHTHTCTCTSHTGTATAASFHFFLVLFFDFYYSDINTVALITDTIG